jgi:predicted HNH restriction endonuclease
MVDDFFGTDTPKRKAVRKNLKKHVVEFQRGKCKECGKSFKKLGIIPDFHHADFNPTRNRADKLQAVCPNCHRKIHKNRKKPKKKIGLGEQLSGLKPIKLKPFRF